MEDTLEKKQRMNLLMDLYEDLLTEKQREYLDLYYHEDLSLSEISLIKNVSKNAVFDNIKKACLHLENYEEKLQLLEKHQKRLEIKIITFQTKFAAQIPGLAKTVRRRQPEITAGDKTK